VAKSEFWMLYTAHKHLQAAGKTRVCLINKITHACLLKLSKMINENKKAESPGKSDGLLI